MTHSHRIFAILIILLAALTACCIAPTVTPQTSTDVAKAQDTSQPEPNTPTDPRAQPEPTVTALPEPTMPVLVGDPVPVLPSGAKINITTIHMLDDAIGWAIGFLPGSLDRHILRTTDGGGTWQQVTPPQPWQVSEYFGMTPAMAVRSATELYVAYGGGPAPIVVWHTTDAGATWTYSQPLEQPAIMDMFFPSDLYFVDAQNGWLMAHLGAGMNHDYIAIYRTTDGGNTWTRVVDPDKNNLTMSFSKNGLHFANSTRGWVTGSTNGVYDDLFLYQTDDGGDTWTQLVLPSPNGDAAFFTTMGNVCNSSPVMIFGSTALLPIACNNYNTSEKSGWLFTSADGGNTWSSASMPSVVYGSYAFINAQTGWLIGEKQIYRTTNGGVSWIGPKVVSWDGVPYFLNATTGWVAAYNDDRSEYALVRTLDGGQNWQIIGTIIK